MKHLTVIPLLLLLSTASRGAFVGPASRHAQSSLSSQKDSIDTDPGNSNNHVPKSAAETTRRAALQLLSSLPLAAASSGALPANGLDAVLSVPAQTKATTWPLGKVAFSLLPLAGSYSRRATVKETIIDDGSNGIWTFDQLQGVVNVNVPVRMTVVKLSPASGGGLWIHNPLAPTPELIQQIKDLEMQHGPVRHIVLGTVALEHKATLGPFAQYFSTKPYFQWFGTTP